MDHEAFVKVWQTSKSAKDAARRLGQDVSKVTANAYSLRRSGIPLKKFKTHDPVNVEHLKKVAAAALAKGGTK